MKPEYSRKCNGDGKNETPNEREGTNLRPVSRKKLNHMAITKIAMTNFKVDAAKLWSVAPQSIKEAKSLNSSKRKL